MNETCIRRILLPLFCFAVLIANSGCVYWRLHQFRNQLSAFPGYFEIQEGDVPVIVSLRPVLQPDDLGWLSGLAASETVREDKRVIELYRYRKQYADAAHDEEGAYDLLIQVDFNAQDRMHALHAPARFAPILTEDNFNEVFAPMKDGTIERAKHATGWVWEEHRVNIPTREEIRDFFGTPYTVAEPEEGLTYTFAYLLEGNETRWNPSDWDIWIRFVFEPDEERVVYSETYVGRLHLMVDLRAEKNVVEIQRL